MHAQNDIYSVLLTDSCFHKRLVSIETLILCLYIDRRWGCEKQTFGLVRLFDKVEKLES